MKKIYVIIVNYKAEEIIKDAVASINEENLEVKTVILDNETTEKSLSVLKKLESENVEVITSKENLGFAGGNNFVANYIKEKYEDATHIFALNPDATLEKNVIFKLYESMEKNDKIAAISPKILDSNGDLWFSGTMIDWKKCAIVNNPPLNEPITEIYDIDVFNGCAVLFDLDKYLEVKGFHEELFLYYDEIFLTKEFEKANYQICYDHNATAHHEVSYSTENYSKLKSYYMTRNHLYYFGEYSDSVLCKYYIPFRNILSSVKNLRFKTTLHGELLGLFHYFINRKGKL